MFAIPFNFPFRKSNGDMSTIGAEINAGGGGGSYTLPTASPTTKGGIKIGDGLSMDGEILNNSNPTPYTLPTASDDILGGVKVGSGLSIDENGVLSANGGGSGGDNKYLHVIYIHEIKGGCLIVTDSSTAMDGIALNAYLNNNHFENYAYGNKQSYPCTGKYSNNNVTGIAISASLGNITLVMGDSSVSITPTIVDTIFAL